MGREILFGSDEGEALWFFDDLVVIKAKTDQTGSWALMDVVHPAGSGPPMHIHRDEDEAFYVVEGKARFYLGDATLEGGPGTFVFLPRGVKHTFQIDPSGQARFLYLTSPHGKFEQFVREISEPASSLTLPDFEGPPDMEKLTQTAAKYTIEIVGPPIGE